MAFIWSPLAATATRNLPPQLAGAGSGVYNATRQVGSVLGSASMAAFMTSRISAEMPPAADGPGGEGSVTQLPGFLHEPFAAAMSQSLLLPAFIALFGVVAALFLLGFAQPAAARGRNVQIRSTTIGTTTITSTTTLRRVHRAAMSRSPSRRRPGRACRADRRRASTSSTTRVTPSRWRRGRISLTPPADTWHDEPVESWHSLVENDEPEPVVAPPLNPDPASGAAHSSTRAVRSLFDFLADVPPPKPSVEPIGFAHNGFHVDDSQRFQPLSSFQEREEPMSQPEPQKPDILSPDYPLDFGSHAHYESPDEPGLERRSRHRVAEDEPTSNGRHSRAEPDDASSRGRHYRPGD